ncbi:isochorismate synthase [Halodesulfurarchaeum formicicum]|uniref:isochorismate synthase n=1 Tax=Halodesulfurarchaeum formicicum TaxID=1873524 RepID=A0A1J1ACD5_9EURY|nr:isochorismate synthase [Halodesulfurarchaeum formicicum]APE95806.1 isochorismate synthase [Halodesulfurarchaeum formicicum]
MAEDLHDRHQADRLDAAVRTTGPRTLREAIQALDPITAVWASPDGPAVLAVGQAKTVTASGAARFQEVKRRGDRLLERVETAHLPERARPRLFGGLSFFDQATLEPPWTDFEPAAFVLPAIQVTLGRDQTLVSGFGAGAAPPRLDQIVQQLAHAGEGTQTKTDPRISATATDLRADRPDWIERVRAIQDRIETGPLQKAVLAAALDVALTDPLPLGAVLKTLTDRYPSCYRFSFTPPGTQAGDTPPAQFFGATPEQLVGKRGRTVETEALAGTVERGATEAIDAANVSRLQRDSTLAVEHEFVASRIAEQLRETAATVTVGDREVRSLANVHHLRTPIHATLDTDTHVLDFVATLHPTPAVGGHPPEAALETIHEVESTVRGWYAAPVGWFDANGDGEFAVGIRSALARDSRVTLFAGNGIVAGSDPETEYEELAAKFRPIREVLE